MKWLKRLWLISYEIPSGRKRTDLPALESSPETSAQVTDIYLAELASRHGMKLATLDASIKHPAVEGI